MAYIAAYGSNTPFFHVNTEKTAVLTSLDDHVHGKNIH
jgi:hypothetical protein